MPTEDESGMEQELEDIYADAWRAHAHPEDGNGEEPIPHVHAPGADWSVTFGIPMTMRHDDALDVIDLMEFRALVMGMVAVMTKQREELDLQNMELAKQQFAIIANAADMMLADSLVAVVDQALMSHGIDPPCQLQPVESSNIRSFGFVLVQAPEEIVPTEGVLYIAFVGGGLYRYAEVPTEVAQAMVEVESRGKYFHEIIKGNYEFVKVV